MSKIKATATLILCCALQITFAQAVDNYAKNKKQMDEEQYRFENELKTNNDSAEVYWKHANVLAAFTFRASKTAGVYYEKAISIDSSKTVYFTDYANYLHQKMEDDSKAKDICSRALKIFPQNKELQKNLDGLNSANSKTQPQKMKENYREFGMYYKAQPATQLIFVDGVNYFNKKNYKAAINCYKKALEMEPEFIDAMDNLGNCYRYMNKLDSAEYWYNKSIILYSDGNIAHQNLAIVYASTSQPEKAVSEYNLLIKLDPENPEGYFGLANINVQLGNGAEVVANAVKARELYKKNNDEYERDAVYTIGVGYYLQKDNKSAKPYLKEAKEMGVDIPEELRKVIK